ncbi:MAG: Rpn family recombination-promoting nuclease/putative transposase [Bryobacterales bacterium]|nr:Rpn family recombination-promoting nuclease/putative transposase [Bryobacterales bacterium]
MLAEHSLAALASPGRGRLAKSMKFDLNKPHDSIFQATLSDGLRSQAVLRAHLEPWQADLLADELPVPLDRSFVDEELRSSQSDKLFEVKLKDGQPGFVYALLEHKSYPDPGTALQVLKYKVRILEMYAQGRAGRLRALPTVIPLVFYHGVQPWTAPGSLAEMVATKDERLRALEPSFGYYLRDLRKIPVERLASDPGARAGLLALRQAHTGGEEEKLRLLPEVVAGPPDNSEFEKQVLLYLMGIWNVPVRTLEKVAEQAKPGRGKAVVGQVVEEIRNRGKAEWLAKGLAKGRAGSLTQLLEHRFGPLPLAVRTRIAGASMTELDARFMVSLDAQSLSEVFPDLDRD